MKTELLKIGLRYNAVYINKTEKAEKTIRTNTANFVANIAKLGYSVEEDLLHQLNNHNVAEILNIYNVFTDLLQVKNNWAPLVKGWDIPTYETKNDHTFTFFANFFKDFDGKRLHCGHLIPYGSFNMERYNGCPFCGTPFELSNKANLNQGSKLKLLKLWNDSHLQELLADLLQSKTALDATQVDSLKTLLKYYTLPDNVDITIKETQILVIDALKEQKQYDAAGKLFQSPADILRYLWYKHTGFLQMVQPNVIIKRLAKNNQHIIPALSNANKTAKVNKASLKLKYNRTDAKIVAKWLNDLTMPIEMQAEIMHPRRAMWVRFIRALRLAEYSKVKGMENLKALLDVFYNKDYTVWAGSLNHYRLKADSENTFNLLKQRPGLFARSLFANMLWFGGDETIAAFNSIAEKLPARLVLTLNSYAEMYFNANNKRVVKPLGSNAKTIKANRLLTLYSQEQLAEMVSAVEAMTISTLEMRYAMQENLNKTIFIDPVLMQLPLPIGDRIENVQDLPAAAMGTKFPVEGISVRLFMQWGKGLPAQHLDMDLSCRIVYENSTQHCSYSQLVALGARHSGDIRSIPNRVGTAEYIELDVNTLQKAKAKYVVFTCNAFSNGSITPNLVVGWMNSKYPMAINSNGVAYDPSCVQHQVRITQPLTKGLIFGVLDVTSREIVWLEQTFQGQTVTEFSITNVELMLKKLSVKTTIGRLLTLKANAQNLIIVDNEQAADEVYNRDWAMNHAAVSQLLID